MNPFGVQLKSSEVFISDGSKCDTANILDIFALGNIRNRRPGIPVYNDTNVMIGRTGDADEMGYYKGLVYMPCTESNGFTPTSPVARSTYHLCFPNNPTGAVAPQGNSSQVGVNTALRTDAIIFFDAAYEAFITDPPIPHSIYEIEGAKRCAIETPLILQDRWLHRGAVRPDGHSR